eukprot:CAMPEP_0172446280 /NCGR_PEP_ID=MMETSP1065-20121228/5912_1 /TAXON_ID=265537 /ORGANISM="Amphiprora paludosa, Strain CCMP125" /LENGTH=192 /DNA_ID=CAMNT_0013197353 /DNA_START=216 /DNA_END=794 /DNA_ORIENTATION=-
MAALVKHSNLQWNDCIPIATALLNALNDEEYSDVTFIVEGQPVYGHKIILIQKCEYFRSMFGSGLRESTEKEIVLPKAQKGAFMLLLEYLYTDQVNLDLKHAVELYNLANMYGLDELKEICCTQVRQRLTVEMATVLLVSADESHCEPIKDVCMAFIVQHYGDVAKSDGIQSLGQALLLQVLKELAKVLKAS